MWLKSWLAKKILRRCMLSLPKAFVSIIFKGWNIKSIKYYCSINIITNNNLNVLDIRFVCIILECRRLMKCLLECLFVYTYYSHMLPGSTLWESVDPRTCIPLEWPTHKSPNSRTSLGSHSLLKNIKKPADMIKEKF